MSTWKDTLTALAAFMMFFAIYFYVSGEDYKDAKEAERAYCHGTCGDKQ